jgi:predicted Zn finger-like uncharacterized protein
MILNCNSCEKKFVVPDQAITASGRTVQCGSCGNKWKQFPITNELGKTAVVKKIKIEKKLDRKKIVNQKRKIVKKTREINLYSPEYLQKKHGINLNNIEQKITKKTEEKVSFGFYNSLILFIILIVAFSRSLYFLQDFIVQVFPLTKFYLDYFFENIRNVFEIWKNLISNY